jgi:predicted RNA-binding protein with TRAM domain
MQLDLELSMSPRVGLATALYGALTTGTVYEVGSFEAVYLLAEPVLLGTTATLDIQHSDSAGSGFSAVDGSSIVMTDVNNGSRSLIKRLRTATLKRYIRVRLQLASGTPLIGATLLFYRPMRQDEQTVVYQTPVT